MPKVFILPPASHSSALASLRTELDPLPIPGPLLAPFKGQAASFTDLRRESVLYLGFSCH